MRVADLVVKAIEKAGVEHVFGVCGGGSVFLNQAIAQSKVKFIACHHEQAAAMAAEGYARAREGLGVVFVTSGPGGTNAITGALGAWTDHVPMLIVSGQSFLKQTIGKTGVRTLGVQEINIVDIVKPITKDASMIPSWHGAEYRINKAIEIAKSGRPGPVWLDIPADVQNEDVEPWRQRAWDAGVAAKSILDNPYGGSEQGEIQARIFVDGWFHARVA